MMNTAGKLGDLNSDKLTETELRLLTLLAEGFTHTEIAEQLIVSPNTVKYHVRSLLKRTGYKNTVSMVAHAVGASLIRL